MLPVQQPKRNRSLYLLNSETCNEIENPSSRHSAEARSVAFVAVKL